MRPEPESDVVLDARGLRALAHPVRMRLVGLLRRQGPATATQLARHMGLTSGATSYHLRQLAAAGLIAEDEEYGNARERWWRSVYRSVRFDDSELMEREPEAAVGYLRSVAAAHASLARRALIEFETMPAAWRGGLDLSSWWLRLTPEEAGRLRAEVEAVVGRYRTDAAESRACAPDGAERVAFVAHLLPEPADPGQDL